MYIQSERVTIPKFVEDHQLAKRCAFRLQTVTEAIVSGPKGVSKTADAHVAPKLFAKVLTWGTSCFLKKLSPDMKMSFNKEPVFGRH